MGNVVDMRGSELHVSKLVADEVVADVSSSGGFAIVAAGQFTTAGGDATETIPATGVLATDIAFVSLESDGTNDSAILTAAAAADSVVVTMNEDPGTDILINWMVVRVV